MAAARQAKLSVLGSANADLYVEVARLPRPGETIPSLPGSGDVKVGGKGCNQAVSLRLGCSPGSAHVSFLGHFGQDTFQPFIRDALKQVGVDDSLCRAFPGCSTGMAIIVLQEKGENSIFLVGGANLEGWGPLLERIGGGSSGGGGVDGGSEERAAAEAQACRLAESDLVLLQCEVPFEVNRAVAGFVRGRAMLDLGGFSPKDFDPEILGDLLVLSANEHELALLAALIFDRQILDNDGSSGKADVDTALVLCQELVGARGDRLPLLFLITLGSQGAVLIRRPAPGASHLDYLSQQAFPMFPGERVLDTTGAGDCYRGVFAAQYARSGGQELARCMDMAAAAASLCVQRMGAMPSYPDQPTVETRLKALGGKSLCVDGWQRHPLPALKQTSRL